jgi:hypothetical protein
LLDDSNHRQGVSYGKISKTDHSKSDKNYPPIRAPTPRMSI